MANPNPPEVFVTLFVTVSRRSGSKILAVFLLKHAASQMVERQIWLDVPVVLVLSGGRSKRRLDIA
jgi:hypothetical protein